MKEPLPKALELLHRAGWSCFECSTEHLVAIDQCAEPESVIAATLDTLHNLQASMPQSHGLLKADIANPDHEKRQTDIATLLRHMRISAALGVKTLVLHPGGSKSSTYASGDEVNSIRKRVGESLLLLADKAAEYGMRLGVENMPSRRGQERRRFGAAPEELVDLITELNHPALGVTIDTDHLVGTGIDVAEAVRCFGALTIATHISDSDGVNISHCLPGTGIVDWPAVIQALRDIDYTGIFNLEIPGERQPDRVAHAARIREAYVTTTQLLAMS